MPKTVLPDWAAVRIRYETTDAAVAEICSDAGIDRLDLSREVRRGGWRRQKPRPFPPLRRAPSRSGSLDPSRVASDTSASSTDAGDSEHAPLPVASHPPAEGIGPGSRPTRRHASRDATCAVQEVRPEAAASASQRGGRPAAPLTPAARRRLLDRLVAAISLKLEQLEHRMAQDFARTLDGDAQADAATATDHERETRAIGALIDNLGKITEIEGGLDRTAGKSPGASGLAGDADRWRRELADRLQRIVGAAAGGP
jgi:hypothetical protein